MTDVCLVQMPYCALEMPSLALGLLKGYLRDAQIETDIVYASFQFADEVGLDVYRSIVETPTETLIGEWTFASAAFPEAEDTSAAFMTLHEAWIQSRMVHLLDHLHPRVDGAALLRNVRAVTPAFVNRLAGDILARRPHIVGCTSSFQQHCASLALLRRVKVLDPSIVTMMGGANCEGIMGETAHREFPWLDFVMSGEVDDFFGSFCARVLREGADVRDVPDGVFARRRGGGDLGPGGRAAPRAVVQSLDRTAVPDYDDYYAALHSSPLGPHIRPVLTFESSRGCWWGMKHHCTFCGLNGAGMSFRSKSSGRVVEEVTHLQQRYGARRLQAVDNIIDMKHLQTVMPALAALDGRPQLFYEVKANLRRDQLRLLRAGGVVCIQPGIENLHDDVLGLLNKGNSWWINVRLLKWSQELGIRVFWNFLCGAPGESDAWYAELAEWLPLLAHLEPPSAPKLQELRYDRFSPYHSTPGQWELELAPNRAYALVYPLPDTALRDLAYFFEDTGPRAREASTTRSGRDAVAAQVRAWCDAWGVHRAPQVQLTAEDAAESTVVIDTRSVAVEHRAVLQGTARLVLKACDAARSRPALHDAVCAVGGADVSVGEVETALEELKARRLVLEWRDRILSVPVNAPTLPYPSDDDSGYVELAALLRRGAATSLARRCVRSPYDVPLGELFPA